YDTLDQVIGHRQHQSGSLVGSGVQYVEADVVSEQVAHGERYSAEKVAELVKPPTRMAYIQKSFGYSFERRTLNHADIEKLAAQVHAANPECIVMVDNCYGEFVEDKEPTAVGADLVAGSLIKNPGGGLAITGGYIAGKKKLVDAALRRLT